MLSPILVGFHAYVGLSDGTIAQWPFQGPTRTLEVPTMYEAYLFGLCKGIREYPQEI